MTTPIHSNPSRPTSPSEQPVATTKEDLSTFVKDVRDSLEDAETSVKHAFDKFRNKRHPRPAPAVPMPDPTAPVAVAVSTPAGERPPVLSPAPAPVLSEAYPIPVFSQARVPAVSVGLVGIKQELENLIAANGGTHLVLESIIKAIEDGLTNPDKEAAVVLTEVAKLMGQFILDEAGYALAHRP